MAHHEEEAPESSERWLVSYSDFITLLMVMFVVLYSMGQTDVKKYKQLAQNMRNVFSMGGAPVNVVDAQISSVATGKTADGSPEPIQVPGIPKDQPQSVEVAGQLTKMLQDQNLGKEVSVQTNVEGVLISLSEKLTFPSGSAELTGQSKEVLQVIAKMLGGVHNAVRLVGHTDNSPAPAPFKNNMDLSIARAVAVSQFLIQNGLTEDRMIISGRGQYDPIFPNDSNEHRALNGRVDIIIVYNVDSSVIGTDPVKVSP